MIRIVKRKTSIEKVLLSKLNGPQLLVIVNQRQRSIKR